jgi:hypothetical protein
MKFNEINNETIVIINNKSKTIDELKKLSKRSCISVISRIKCDNKIREYLYKWIFEKYYLIEFNGNLTSRIKNINTKICYKHIITHCFDNIDPLETCKHVQILNNNCKDIIKSLHAIDPSMTGIYVDYLIRRIINELRQNDFIDQRAERFTNIKEININDNIQIWQFNTLITSTIGSWVIFSKPNLDSELLVEKLCNGDKFMELDRKDEWMKITFRKCVGWVRYLLPSGVEPFWDPEKVVGFVSTNIKNYIPNKWFSKIDNSYHNHYCVMGCKTEITQQILYNMYTLPNNCIFPYCQNICYKKVKDTTKYKTVDILIELLIVSCCHTESFGYCPKQHKFDQFINILENINKSLLISSLTHLCKTLILNSKDILLNPALGEDVYNIPSDCDLVVDDILIDIKCTNKRNDMYEMLQLLGYSSLLNFNEKYKLHIKQICILNILKCEYNIYNIKNIYKDNLLEYLLLLTNKYDSSKILIHRNNELYVSQLVYNTTERMLIDDKTIHQNKHVKSLSSISFNYKNLTPMNLTRYGIFSNDHDINRSKHCLIIALQHHNTLKLKQLENMLSKITYVYMKTLALISILINCKITCKTRSKTGKQSTIITRYHNGKTIKNVKEFNMIKSYEVNLGLIEEHFFIDESTKYTTKWIKSKGWINNDNKTGKNITSFKVIELLLTQYKQETDVDKPFFKIIM